MAGEKPAGTRNGDGLRPKLMVYRFRYFSMSVAAIGLWACSSASPSAGTTALKDDASFASDSADLIQDAALEDAAPPDASFDARQCHAVLQRGMLVSVSANAGKAPAPAGGTTRDGTYVLTSMVVYGTTSAIPYSLTATLETQALNVNVVEDSGNGETRKTGNGKVDGVNLQLTETCAFPARRLRVETAAFTASDDSIALFGNVGGFILVQTYTRQ